MNIDIPTNVHDEIEALIASDSSPVGIDAKETHILIIHALLQIQEKLENIEQQLANGTSS